MIGPNRQAALLFRPLSVRGLGIASVDYSWLPFSQGDCFLNFQHEKSRGPETDPRLVGFVRDALTGESSSDSIRWLELLLCVAHEAELHYVCVFDSVVVVISQNRRGFETEVSEEQLCRQIRLADLQQDFVATLL